jgi:hypothetical protein
MDFTKSNEDLETELENSKIWPNHSIYVLLFLEAR